MKFAEVADELFHQEERAQRGRAVAMRALRVEGDGAGEICESRSSTSPFNSKKSAAFAAWSGEAGTVPAAPKASDSSSFTLAVLPLKMAPISKSCRSVTSRLRFCASMVSMPGDERGAQHACLFAQRVAHGDGGSFTGAKIAASAAEQKVLEIVSLKPSASMRARVSVSLSAFGSSTTVPEAGSVLANLL